MSNLNEYFIQDFIKYTINKLYKNSPEIAKGDKLYNKISREVNEFYSIFKYQEAIDIISLFKNPIPIVRDTVNNKDELNHKYMRRLGKELYLIKQKHFFTVFKQVYEILNLTTDMIHIIRGSSGSSLVCYLLGITHIDPIQNKICLARFMHSLRDDIPDIDIDFPTHLRDIVYKRIFEKYGKRVARISNHIHYRAKTAIKQAMRNNGINGFIPREFNCRNIIRKRVKLDTEVEYRELEKKISDEAKILNGTERTTSLHCGGIFIMDHDIPDDLIYKEMDNGGYQVSLDKDEVENAGLIKIDILSNRGLTIIMEIYSDLRENGIGLPSFENLPIEQEVFTSLIQNNIGIVNAESRGMYQIFNCVKPSSIEQLSICLSIIRPAASVGGQKSYYMKSLTIGANDDDIMIEVVDDNMKGFKIPWIIYDDDAIIYIQKLLHIDESEADIYRKAFSKNNKKLISEFQRRLLALNGMTTEKLNDICERLASLQEYSFCKSHAISYSYLIYALAYLKHHYPKYFWKAVLNNINSSYRTWVHYREASKFLKLVDTPRPYKFSNNTTALIPANNTFYQTKLFRDDRHDYGTLGFWTSPKFLSGMYYYLTNNSTNKTSKLAHFKGLIATYKHYNRDGRKATFITLGYDDGCYIDIVIDSIIRLSYTNIIKGTGELLPNKYIKCAYLTVVDC